MKKVGKELRRKTRLVLKSGLNAARKTEAINILAVPVITYSFSVINWRVNEIKKIDAKTRKLLTMP